MYMSDNNTRTQQNPSFSSTLLDKIYRSLQEGDSSTEKTQMSFYPQTTSSKNHRTRTRCNSNNRQDDDVANPNLRRAYEFQKWMDHKKKENDKVSTKLTRHHHRHHHQDVVFFSSSSSSSSSSDSSSGGFSSSDTESIPPMPAPVKTKSREQNALFHEQRKVKHKAANHEKEKRSMSSLKIYENLKKTKQPISPGGRLATFLNSLLMKSKKSTCSVSGQASTCPSSASSFSRSCFNKTTSSLSPPSGEGVRRTVRFYPVSVIVNEEDNKKKSDLNFRGFSMSDEEEEDDDDDAASDSSSDLFELDHLVVLGRDRYSEELPVYETANLSTNRAIIANGLIV